MYIHAYVYTYTYIYMYIDTFIYRHQKNRKMRAIWPTFFVDEEYEGLYVVGVRSRHHRHGKGSCPAR